MTFNEAEAYWKERFKDAKGEYAEMIETALEAFKDRKMYIADCENLREVLEHKPTPHDYVATMTNFLDGSGAERAEATFDVDDCKVTVIAKRKEEA